MYLYVAVFLLMAVMGLFSELYLLQAARIWGAQKSAAEILHLWHTAVYTKAKNLNVAQWNHSSGYCRLSLSLRPNLTGATACIGKDFDGNALSPVLLSSDSDYLPAGTFADASLVQSISTVSFNKDGTQYILTYVQPVSKSSSDPAFLGFKGGEIYKQMKNARFPKIAYGRVLQGSCNGVPDTWFFTGYAESVDGTATYTTTCYPIDDNLKDPLVGAVGFMTVL